MVFLVAEYYWQLRIMILMIFVIKMISAITTGTVWKQELYLIIKLN